MGVLTEYRFKNITFEEFDQKINEAFGTELIPIMDDWFTAKSLPGFLISPLSAVQVHQPKLKGWLNFHSDLVEVLEVALREEAVLVAGVDPTI